MIFAAIITQSWLGDLGVAGTVLGLFAAILKMQVDSKNLQRSQAESRKAEIKSVLNEVITAQPEKMVVSPQPFIVEMRKEFVDQSDHIRDIAELSRRIGVLEGWRESDKNEMRGLIAAIPGQVIHLLKLTKGLIE